MKGIASTRIISWIKNCLKFGIMLVVTFNQIPKKNILKEGNKITNIFTNVFLIRLR